MDQFWFYFKLGLTHVLNIHAYDHVLFIVALVASFSFKDWKNILWLVTMFTLGHTLSLILSVYGVVSVSATLIEFLIPLTILITAFFNILRAGKGAKKEQYGVVFFVTLFFGIIHGLAFGKDFKPVVVQEDNKLLALLEFALGIEAAQVLVVLVVLILGFIIQSIFRFNRKDWVLVISSIVIGLIIPMLIANYPY